MPTIPVTDSLGLKIDLRFNDESDAARLGLAELVSKTSQFVTAAVMPLDVTPFESALFGGIYKTPQFAVGKNALLAIKAGANTALRVYRSSQGRLFETEAAPEIPIGAGEAWVSFEIDASLLVNASTGTAAGFGVSGEHLQTHSVSVYTHFASEAGRFPTLLDAAEQAISAFRIPQSAADFRNQPRNSVYEWDVAGSFAIEGTYAYPLAVNAFTLASKKLPLGRELTIAPDVEMSLAGSLAVTGEFRGRSYRASDSKIQIGLYKKHETDLDASFTAKAGLSATVDSTDLVATLFHALPGANWSEAQLAESDRAALRKSLGAAVDQGLSIALNAMCSAARADEAAVLFEVDLNGDREQTDRAIEDALSGNWTALSKLPNAKELRNVVTRIKETGWKASLNLLGIYNYVSISDFVQECRILHNLADGTITITDRETAQRISAASSPFAAQDDKLRKVIEESFLATAAYSAAGAALSLSQSLLIYRSHENYSALKKDLLIGEAVGLLSAGDLASVPLAKEFRYCRIAAGATFEAEDALRLFFADIATRSPRTEEELKRLGRSVLIALLDPAIASDDVRRQMLASDTLWARLEQQQFPANSPASYSDWYDIVTWAYAIAAVAPRLKDVLEAWQTVSGDPSTNANFMAARESLAGALAEVTKRTHAAFERGWPIAVMFALSGRRVPVTFEAQWDGIKHFEKQSVRVMRA